MSVIKFGTDGWRAVTAEDFTFTNVRACAQGVVDMLRSRGATERPLVVGYDTRFASEDFAAAVAEVAAAGGLEVYLCDRAAPTPVISYAVLHSKGAGAVIITASHNPRRYNGFKFKPEYAGSAPAEITNEIERGAEAALARGGVPSRPLEEARAAGLVKDFDPRPPYEAHVAELVDLPGLRQSGLRVVVDSMYGTGAGYLARFLGGGSLHLIEIHGERNPAFPGLSPEPIPPHIDELQRRVVEGGADVGLATDGDADRVGLVDEKGNFINQLQVFGLLALYLLDVRGERGTIVKSATTTSMLYRLGEQYGVPVIETPVGFKYIAPHMIKENALIGGEESGGFGFRGHIPERDGILSSLYLLDLIVKLGRTPSETVKYLYEKVGPHYYDRIDLEFSPEQRQEIQERVARSQPQSLDGVAVTRTDTVDGFRFHLADGGWLLIRFSGTEPKLRIYCETGEAERVPRLLSEGRRLAGV